MCWSLRVLAAYCFVFTTQLKQTWPDVDYNISVYTTLFLHTNGSKKTFEIIGMNKQTKSKKQSNTSTNKVHLMFIM